MDDSIYSEEELIKRSMKGDERAFRILVEKYQNILYGTAYLILRDRQMTEEAVQETILKMWKHLGSLHTENSIKPWLMKVIINEANRQFRKKNLPTVPLEEVPEQEDAGDMDEMLIHEENHHVLREALAELSPEQREAVILRYFSDLTVPEIAAATSIPEGTIKSRLSRALDRLYTVIGGSDNFKRG
jgi:RNA polymerase sigma-70 factor (ECF subfamily)